MSAFQWLDVKLFFPPIRHRGPHLAGPKIKELKLTISTPELCHETLHSSYQQSHKITAKHSTPFPTYSVFRREGSRCSGMELFGKNFWTAIWCRHAGLNGSEHHLVQLTDGPCVHPSHPTIRCCCTQNCTKNGKFR